MLRPSHLALIVVFVLPTLAHPAVTRLACVQTGPTEYRLSYALTGNSHSVQISASSQPVSPTVRPPILQTSKNEVTVKAGKPGDRMYFFLKPNGGEEREVSIRHLSLQGTPNFRDLGGYQTEDGYFTKWE